MSPTPQSLTVVMPVFNEEATIRASLERLLKAEVPLPIEILIVDDGSSDASIGQIQDLVDAHDHIRVIRHPRNLGKGAAVRTGIAQASGDLLTIFDADMEYEPADYASLIAPIIEGKTSVVFGTREFGAHTAFSFWFVIGNKLLALWASFLFNSWLTDIETCFKIAPTEVWRDLDIRSNGFGIEAEVTAKLLKRGHRIYESPISYQARSREEGKKIRWTDGVAALWIMSKIRLFGKR